MTGLRMVTADQLRACLSFEDLIEPVADAFRETSLGKADNGLIVMFPAETRELGDVYVKSGVLAGHDVHIVKVSPWFAANASQGLPQGGFVGVFDSRTGHTLALLADEHYLSDIRTAAAGAVAARLLAPERVRTAAVLGAGVQAFLQPRALYGERPFETLLIWARSAEKAERLREKLAPHLPDVDIRLSGSLEQTVRNADVLITATQSRSPLVQGDWLREGQHITAIGADDPSKCELSPGALHRAQVFVDSRETAIANGDVHRAISTQAYSADELAGEIGEILAGAKPGRSDQNAITIAKFIGIGAQDLVAAETALRHLGAAGPAN